MSLKEILDNTISKPWANLYVESIDAEAGIQNNNLVVNDSLTLPFITNSYIYSGSTGVAQSKVIQEADVHNLTTDLTNIYTDINSLFITSSSNSNGLITQQTQINSLAAGQTGQQTQINSLSAGQTGIANNVSNLQTNTFAITASLQGGSTGTNVASDLTTNVYGDATTNVFVGRASGRWFNNPATTANVVISQRTGNFTGTNQLVNSVLVGTNAGFNMTGNSSVNGSVIVGQIAAQGITNGSGNVIIGRNAQNTTNVNGVIAIGVNASATTDNEIVIASYASTVMRPATNNTVDIGSTSIRYKDMYLSGTGFVNTLGSIGATLTINSDLVIPSSPYFEMYSSAGTGLVFTANTWRLVILTNTSKFANLFTNNTTTMASTYTSTRSRTFNCIALFSVTVANINSTLSCFFSINGNIVPSSSLVQTIITAAISNTITYNFILRDMLTLNTNDVLALAMQSSTSTTITYTSASISAMSLPN